MQDIFFFEKSIVFFLGGGDFQSIARHLFGNRRFIREVQYYYYLTAINFRQESDLNFVLVVTKV